MIKKYGRFIFIILILVAALYLRFRNYEGRTVYGWDQARDVAVIENYFSTGKLPLLGPIVRGDIGGFYLGPLYHYLLIPLYRLAGDNPLSLVWFSLALDVGVAAGLAFAISPVAAVIWAVSSMLINSSLTPWNVSLVHAWTLAVVLLVTAVRYRPSRKLVGLLLFVLAVSTSIHLTLIPLAGIILIWLTPVIRRTIRSVRDLGLYGLYSLCPLAPLIISDLNTRGANLRGFYTFLRVHAGSTNESYLSFLGVFFHKLGFTVSRLFAGEPYLIAGLLIFGGLFIYGLRRMPKDRTVMTSMLVIVVTVVSLLIYRDTDFAEYYFNSMMVPMVILAALLLRARTLRLALISILAVVVYLNVSSLNLESGPFSMGVKRELLSRASSHLESGVELRMLVPDHQQFGFGYYLRRLGIKNDPNQTLKLYIAPSDLPHVPAPADAQSVIYQDKLAAFQLVLFRN